MARSYYIRDDKATPHQAFKREESLVTKPCSNQDSHKEVARRSSSCASSTPDSDSKSGSLGTRRRIQVACCRCRKRKIKCSGDPGDGQGCSNCRSSGVPNCLFLRVNSAPLQTKAGCNTAGWPYPAVSPTVCSSPKPGFHGSHAVSTTATMSDTSSPSLRVPVLSRASSYVDATTMDLRTFNRHNLGLDDSISAEADLLISYNLQSSPTYVLPGNCSPLSLEYYGPSWSPRPWTTSLTLGNSLPSRSLYAEQDAPPVSTVHPRDAFPYSVDVQNQIAATADIPSIYAGAACHLTTELQPARDQSSSQSQLQTHLSVIEAGSDTSSTLSSLVPDSKPKDSGSFSKSESIKTSQPVSEDVPSKLGPYGTPSSIGNASNPIQSSSNTTDITFGFLPATPVCASASPSLSRAAYCVSSVEPLAECPDGLATNSNSHDGSSRFMRTRKFPRRANGYLSSLSNCSDIVYGYSSSEKSRYHTGADDVEAAATLVNGLVYVPVKHQDSHPSFLISPEAVPLAPLTDAQCTLLSSLAAAGY